MSQGKMERPPLDGLLVSAGHPRPAMTIDRPSHVIYLSLKEVCMKKAIGIFTMFMTAGFIIAWGSGLMDKAQKPKVEQKILLISGNEYLTATDLTLNEKDRVTVKATGYIFFSSGNAQSKTGPEGWGRSGYAEDWPEDATACDDPLMDENHAALIAEVDGEVFMIGKEASFSGKAGLLFLGINDCTFTGDLYNSGQFSVIIKIERAGGHQ